VSFRNQNRNKIKANITREVRITYHSGAFLQPLLQWNSSITYSECVCCLMYPACPFIQYFSTLYQKRHDFL